MSDDPMSISKVTRTQPDGTVTGYRPFELEPSAPQGEIPRRIVDELIECRRIAKDYAQSYADAVKNQAEKHGIPVGALKRYVAALADDKVEEASIETEALEKLLAERV